MFKRQQYKKQSLVSKSVSTKLLQDFGSKIQHQLTFKKKRFEERNHNDCEDITKKSKKQKKNDQPVRKW